MKTLTRNLLTVGLVCLSVRQAYISPIRNVRPRPTYTSVEAKGPDVAKADRRYVPRMRNLHGVSGNWAGYAIEATSAKTQNSSVTKVSGTWVVPTVVASDSPDTFSAAWIGIDGFNSNTVEQIGTEHDVITGIPHYYAWFELYPHPPIPLPESAYPVFPGDVITASVEYLGNDQFRLTLVNTTRSWPFETTQTLKNAKRKSAEWIVEAPYGGGILPLANFSSVMFTGCGASLNDLSGGIDNPNWQNEPIDMSISTTRGEVLLKADAYPLVGSDSFVVQWFNE